MVQGRGFGFQDTKDCHRGLIHWYGLLLDEYCTFRLRMSLTRRIIDKKCPFTGMVSIRGRILSGTVVSTKMHRTLIIRREYLHFVPKYARYEKRHKNLAAHVSPAFRVEEGDQVTVGQCRPLSKTVSADSFAMVLLSVRSENRCANEMVRNRFDSMFCVCSHELARRSRRLPSFEY